VTDDVQAAFSRAFGPLEGVKIGSEGAGTFYNRLDNLSSDGGLVPETHRQALTARANQLWHTDSSFKQTPALASVFSARIVPQHGAVVTHSYAHSRDQIDPNLMTDPAKCGSGVRASNTRVFKRPRSKVTRRP
jgi:alpha-ketoglutarate-dependent 2,4-dichlorophenoxyacetate dioxygenase